MANLGGAIVILWLKYTGERLHSRNVLPGFIPKPVFERKHKPFRNAIAFRMMTIIQPSAVLFEAADELVDAVLSGNYLADAVLEQIAQLSEGMVKRRLLKHPLFDLLARTPGIGLYVFASHFHQSDKHLQALLKGVDWRSLLSPNGIVGPFLSA